LYTAKILKKGAKPKSRPHIESGYGPENSEDVLSLWLCGRILHGALQVGGNGVELIGQGLALLFGPAVSDHALQFCYRGLELGNSCPDLLLFGIKRVLKRVYLGGKIGDGIGHIVDFDGYRLKLPQYFGRVYVIMYVDFEYGHAAI
jgi:hypothetical protein